jgi:molybdenum cofactor biosynthesis protein B
LSFREHRALAPAKLRIGVIVISDFRASAAKRGLDLDQSGKLIQREAEKRGHETSRVIVPDSRAQIRKSLRRLLREADAVILTGGTGITKRDVTVETVEPMFDKSLPGFGEILRRIGYEKVGTPALLTRAVAGIIDQKPVFCLPGAPNAVKVAMRLILPDLPHLVKHARE